MREREIRAALRAVSDEVERRRSRAARLGLPAVVIGAGLVAQACSAYEAPWECRPYASPLLSISTPAFLI